LPFTNIVYVYIHAHTHTQTHTYINTHTIDDLNKTQQHKQSRAGQVNK